MAYGVIDLHAGSTADDFVSALDREMADEKDANHPLEIWVSDTAGRVRLTLFALFGNVWLGRMVMRVGGAVERAVVGLDHDEYGVEHVVLDGRGGALVRVHHVYVYPDGKPDEECSPSWLTYRPGRT